MDVDPVAGQHAVVDLAVRDREVALGLDRNVVRPQHRIAPAVHLVDRDGNGAVAVGVFEREIDPDLGLVGELLDVEFARGDHHLPLDAVDHVAVDVDAGKGVVGPQALGLLQLRFERAPVPDARVAQGCCALVEILAGERRGRDGEFLFLASTPRRARRPPACRRCFGAGRAARG